MKETDKADTIKSATQNPAAADKSVVSGTIHRRRYYTCFRRFSSGENFAVRRRKSEISVNGVMRLG